MRNTFLLLSIGLGGAVSAQPVLEYNNLQIYGYMFPAHLVTDPGNSDPTPDGANVTWDFSSATLAMNAGWADFGNPANTPYSANFPSSNLALVTYYSNATRYAYFNLQPTQMDMLGEDFGGPAPRTYTDPKTPLIFPFAYQDSFVDNYDYGNGPNSSTRSYTGYGTVILPTGTYNDVVKVTSSSGAINFYRSNPAQPLVQIEDDGTVIVFDSPVIDAVGENPAPALTAVPNPATDAVAVSGVRHAGSWSLIDAGGRMVRQGRMGPGTLNIPLADLAPGCYGLVLEDSVGRQGLRLVKQ